MHNIATYNVKRFGSRQYRKIPLILEEENVMICGLQEVPGKSKLEAMFKNTNYNVIYDDLYFSYGNGLVYRKDLYDLIEHQLFILKKGINKKGLLKVVLKGNDGKILNIYVTHLDHKTEEERMKELNVLYSRIPSNKNCILMGDFNSLTKEDYDDEELANITLVRQNDNWELPKFDVTDSLKNNAFIDTLCDNVVPTSRFNTRIDYIFIKGYDFDKSCSRVIINNHNRNDLSSTIGVSDHLPIMTSII